METIYDSDGSAARVQGLHNAALNGDTITLPAGTFTWTTHVAFTQLSTFKVQAQATTIYDNVPKTGGPDSVLWSFDVSAGIDSYNRVYDSW